MPGPAGSGLTAALLSSISAKLGSEASYIVIWPRPSSQIDENSQTTPKFGSGDGSWSLRRHRTRGLAESSQTLDRHGSSAVARQPCYGWLCRAVRVGWGMSHLSVQRGVCSPPASLPPCQLSRRPGKAAETFHLPNAAQFAACLLSYLAPAALLQARCSPSPQVVRWQCWLPAACSLVVPPSWGLVSPCTGATIMLAEHGSCAAACSPRT